MENSMPVLAAETLKNGSLFDLPSVLAPGCPWVDVRTEYGLPNVNWCEATLCQWIAEPSNTWSNLGYVLSAVFLAWWIRREKLQSPVLRTFPLAALLVGLSSGIYHASVTYALQLLDYAGMYFFIFLPMGFQLVRHGWIRPEHFRLWYFAKVIGLTVFTWAVSTYTSFPIQGLVLLLILSLFGAEVVAYRVAVRKGRQYSMKWLAVTFGTMLGALACMIADVKRFHCDPDNHGWFAQGHSLWHWLGAVALGISILHYSQFEKMDRPAMA